MLKTLKRLYRATTARSASPPAPGLPNGMPPAALEGLRLDGRVNIQLIDLCTHPDALFHWDNEAFHHIAAVGHVDLGQGAHLVRFYLDNDTWLQANIEQEQVVEYKLFDFYRVAQLSPVEFDTLVNGTDPHTNPTGAQTVTITSTDTSERRCTYQRVWGDDAQEWSPPAVFEEQVVTTDSISSRYVTHHAMLFERAIQDAERMEYALVSAENDGDGGFMVVYNVGVDVAPMDIDAL
jgi:hypothetical protein